MVLFYLSETLEGLRKELSIICNIYGTNMEQIACYVSSKKILHNTEEYVTEILPCP